MLSNAFAGSIYLLNQSNKTIRLFYTIKTKSGALLEGRLYSTPFKSPTGQGVGGDVAYEVNSLVDENYTALPCAGLELNKFYSDVRVSFNAAGACAVEITG